MAMTTSSPTSDSKRSSTASRAAAHFHQSKLSVSQRNDSYEQEADHVADIVVNQPSRSIGVGAARSNSVQGFSAASAVSARVTPTISRLSQRKALSRMGAQEEEPQAKMQREMEEEEPQAKIQREMEEEEPQAKVQREMEEEEPQAKVQREMEEEPQTKTQEGPQKKSGHVSDEMEAQINSSKGQGAPLPDDVRVELERLYATDFREVRIHTDSQAATLSKSLGAKAFTKGHDLYFNEGQYQPYSVEGRRLLAHELTHVVQQGASSQQDKVGAVQRKPESTGGVPAALVSSGGSAAMVQRGAFDALTDGLGAAWDSATGAVVDAAGNVLEVGSEFFWDMLGRLAPSLVPLLREISSKGILTFLYDKLTGVLGGIFDRLENTGGVIGTLAATFRLFVTQASDILVALAQGECEPLFAAVRQFKEIVSQIAGDAWDAISEFFAPIGEFFSNVWQSFGAPLVDWLSGTAADVWEWIQNLGKQIWDWTQPVRNALGAAWDWVKDQLGFGGGGEEGDGEGGLIGWVKGKASEAWQSIQVKLQPVIAPIQAVVAKVQAVLPLEAIFNLRETITGWLDNVGSMTQSLEEEDGAATHQASLREEILPGVLRTIQSVRAALISAGTWVATQYGAVATTVTGFLDVLKSNTLLGHVSGVLQWLSDGVTQLSAWAQETVVGVFTLVGEGLVRLSRFVEPILNALQKVLEVLGNLMGKLPDLILGPVWWILPRCIKDPIKDFILNQVLKRIPFFNQFLELGDVWAKIKTTALTILTQIFVDGNLLKALWTLFKAVLGIFNIPPQLVTNIIIKATEALGDIIKNPIGFIINILKAVKEGFVRFFSNILKHLFSGVVDWLFGHLKDAGIEIPPDFSLKSILGMVFQILGVTIEKLWKKLADKIGQDKVDKLKKVISVATGVWEWIRLAVEEGPGAVWVKLKEKISGLWTSVLSGVVGWINQVIIIQGTKWLFTLLDVSGITPTITGLIAIYKAIESFFEYFNRMLAIVNSVLNGLADLAKGAISSAAAYVEDGLVRSIPIVIGFLANQFGLGRLGHKLSEIVGAVREKVDGAIDWLIDNALKLGQAFLNTLKRGVEAVKGGVAALVEWWKMRKAFKAKDGSDHSLYFTGKGKQATLMVASSNPVSLHTLIKTKKWNNQQIDESIISRLNAQLQIINTNASSNTSNSGTQTAGSTSIDAALNEIKKILAEINLEFAGPMHYPTGKSKRDPILINWYKDKSDYPHLQMGTKCVEIGKKLKIINISHQVITRKYLKTANSAPWKKQNTGRGSNGEKFMERLRDNQVRIVEQCNQEEGKDINRGRESASNTFRMDHVRDVALGGADDGSNVWPLQSEKNEAANATGNQWVLHDGEVKRAKDLPEQIYVSARKVRRIPSSSGGHGTTKSNPYVGGSSISLSRLKRDKKYTGDSANPVPIIWFKRKSDYPKVDVEENGTRTTKNIGDSLNINGSITLQVAGEHLNPEGWTWQKTKTTKRTFAAQARQALLEKVQASTPDRYVIRKGRQELEPDPGLETKADADHVLDRNFSGPDTWDNIWALRADKNQAAAANSRQFVAYQDTTGGRSVTVVGPLQNVWVKVVKQMSAPSSEDGHGTSTEKPAGETELKTLQKTNNAGAP